MLYFIVGLLSLSRDREPEFERKLTLMHLDIVFLYHDANFREVKSLLTSNFNGR